jgi:hypothetical protein
LFDPPSDANENITEGAKEGRDRDVSEGTLDEVAYPGWEAGFEEDGVNPVVRDGVEGFGRVK